MRYLSVDTRVDNRFVERYLRLFQLPLRALALCGQNIRDLGIHRCNIGFCRSNASFALCDVILQALQ